jgi:hypothetical protein
VEYLIFILIIIALPLVTSFTSGKRRFRKKARLIFDYTLKKGYRLLNPSIQETFNSSGLEILRNPSLRSFLKGSTGITDIEDFGRGTDDPFGFTCDLQSKEVTIFSFSVSSQRVDGKGGDITYKVAKIKKEGLPRFSLGRRSVVHSVENIVQKLVGKPAPTIDVDRRMGSEFADHYWLEAPDGDAIFTFLSPEKLAFIASAGLKGTIATNPNYLVYREDGDFLGESDFDSFISTVEKIVTNLL